MFHSRPGFIENYLAPLCTKFRRETNNHQQWPVSWKVNSLLCSKHGSQPGHHQRQCSLTPSGSYIKSPSDMLDSFNSHRSPSSSPASQPYFKLPIQVWHLWWPETNPMLSTLLIKTFTKIYIADHFTLIQNQSNANLSTPHELILWIPYAYCILYKFYIKMTTTVPTSSL